MRTYLFQLTLLLKRLTLIVLLYQVCRFFFFVFNRSHFSDVTAGDLFSAFFFGMRFDLITITFSNALFIILSLIPARFVFSRAYRIVLKATFIIPNALFLLLNSIDLAYFRFTNKRSGYDIFNQIFGGQTDVMKQLPDYLSDFWPVFIVFALLLSALFYGWKRIKADPQQNNFNYTLSSSASYFGLFSFSCALMVLGMRGGFQYIPLQIVDANKYTSPENVALVLNTPFSIIRSMETTRLPELNLTDNKEAFRCISPVKQYSGKSFQKKNVVILILESFSKEYTGAGGRKSLTPFLDSLTKEGLYFSNAWANGKQSIEGVPAIISGMPSFMLNPYINTSYADNRINSIPQLLKKSGYITAFFHGGKNGTMNFDSYASMAGFDHYFGKNEYGNDKDFDGNWGIWDEPFLQYCSKKFTEFKSPFFASVFTLSSHHPYKVPEQYAGKFPKTALEISESVGYADLALRKFFESAKKESWYQNTVFVLVPDHTGTSSDYFYKNPVGQHAIPIVFFAPDGSFKGESEALMQQIDVLPTLMDTLGYSHPFYSFGKSAFRKSASDYALFFESGNYYALQDSLCFVFSDYKCKQVFLYSRDSVLQNNRVNEFHAQQQKAESYIRNFLQLYHSSLNSNSCYAGD